jgi:hypothetical protein
VSSLRKLYANWLNARFSTGPRTAAGKARAAQNARKHGLRVPALRDPAMAKNIGALARKLAGPNADAQRFAAACRLVAAQIDLLDIREARLPLLSRVLVDDTALDRLTTLISMSALRAHGGSPRPGSSAPYVLQWPQTAGKQSVMTPAATRSTLRPCCGSCLQRKLRGYRESAATAPRAELTCGQGGDLM